MLFLFYFPSFLFSAGVTGILIALWRRIQKALQLHHQHKKTARPRRPIAATARRISPPKDNIFEQPGIDLTAQYEKYRNQGGKLNELAWLLAIQDHLMYT